MGERILKSIFKAIRRRYEEYKKKSQIRYCSKYVDCDPSANIDGLRLSIRGEASRKFMKIGANSLIDGAFIFEKDTGFINIGERTQVGSSTFVCIEEIKIGNDVLISWGCTFVDNNSHSINSNERAEDVMDWKRGIDEKKIGKYKKWDKVKRNKIIIEDKVWIGFNCIITKGITIGEGAVIGAGSVVVKDIPPYTLAVGNPAIVIKKIN